MKSLRSKYNPSNDNIDYDSINNLFYLRTHPEVPEVKSSKATLINRSKPSKMVLDSGSVSNIAIYDIINNQTDYLFDNNNDRRIYHLLFETGYDADEEIMHFNKQTNILINQEQTDTRTISDKLFIVTNSDKIKEYKFWTATRNGKNLQCIHTYRNDVRARIDVKNKKILFIDSSHNNQIKITAFDW